MRTFFSLILFLTVAAVSAQDTVSTGTCKAYFKYEVNDKLMMPYAATAINFYDHSAGKVKEWYWDFGEGNTSREQNPMFIFKHPVSSPNVRINPYRTISLTILTDSCKSYYSVTINILDGKPYQKPDCHAGFKYYISTVDSLLGKIKVQFTNLSEGDSLKFLWKLGDGMTSAEREPLVTFDRKPEKRYVCLTVTGINSCTDTFCDTIFLGNPAEPKPEDCFVYFGYAVNTKIMTFAPALVLDFYAKTPAEVAEWKWDFGDGNSSNEPNPTHIFNFPVVKDSVREDPNPYRTVTLTIVTKSGCIAKWSDVIYLYMNSKPPIDTLSSCHAWFKYYRPIDIITIPEVVPFQFKDGSEGKAVRWLWQFENGDTSTLQNPLVTFSIFKPTQKVCLTVFTADSCSNTWCETVYVSQNKPDTTSVSLPACPYVMRIKSGFPVQMSSCAGWAQAQVYLKDSLIKASDYKWSTGVEGQEANNLCPTSTYTVKARTPDGCVVTCTFILNSDGTIKEIPVTWWVDGSREYQNIQYNLNDKSLSAEWKLPDGSIVRSDSIPLSSMNGGSEIVDLVIRDSSGNIVYTEKIALKAFITGNKTLRLENQFTLFPVPAGDILYVRYSGQPQQDLGLMVIDLSGRILTSRQYGKIMSGQVLELDVSKFQDGIYFCKMVMDHKEVIVKKFTR